MNSPNTPARSKRDEPAFTRCRMMNGWLWPKVWHLRIGATSSPMSWSQRPTNTTDNERSLHPRGVLGPRTNPAILEKALSRRRTERCKQYSRGDRAVGRSTAKAHTKLTIPMCGSYSSCDTPTRSSTACASRSSRSCTFVTHPGEHGPAMSRSDRFSRQAPNKKPRSPRAARRWPFCCQVDQPRTGYAARRTSFNATLSFAFRFLTR